MKPILFIIIFLLYLGANFYVFYRVWVTMPPNLIGRIILISFASISILSLVIFYLLDNVMPIGLSSFFYKIGTSWLFILIYFFIVVFVRDLFVLANRYLHFMPADALSRYTRDNWVGLAFMIGFIALLMVCGYLKYRWKVRVEVPIEIEKNSG